jgi:integrase
MNFRQGDRYKSGEVSDSADSFDVARLPQAESMATRSADFSNMLPSPSGQSRTTHHALPRFVTVSYYGSQLAVRGVPMSIIQQLMGHTNPATTTIYTRATANDTTGVLDDAGWL